MTRHAQKPTLAALAGLALLSLGGTARAQEEESAPRHARVAASGARVLNLADRNGVAIASPAVGDLVAIHGENQTGWILVEVPGGYPVWVSGRYLKATAAADVFEVTRNAVNIRPGPSSDVTNFPLPQRLHAGDRVRLIELLEPGKPMAETWARIWSPPGVRAWMLKSAVEVLPATEDGAALWAEALARAPEARSLPPVEREAVEAAAPAEAAADETLRADLDAALAELDRLAATASPDFTGVRAAIEAVLAQASGGAIALEARETLRRVDVLERAAVLRAELEEERRRRIELANSERQRVLEASKKKDPLGDAFLARGALFRRLDTEGVPRYFLRFGGETVGELVCSSGRYDLELFAGYEIGVQGTELSPDATREFPVVQLARVEVIQRR
jgi:hypothetical protein